eukprot:m.279335 g.279335  ORF g.279335 m.279335 type:complete len:1153 (+) comp16321_c1_seq28:177-3635(+)
MWSMFGGSSSTGADPLEKQKIALTIDGKDDVYTVKSLIATGGFGEVYKLQAPDKRIFALKRLRAGTRDQEVAIKKEMNLMTLLKKKKNKNIVNLLVGASRVVQKGNQNVKEYLLVMEYCPGGNLQGLLGKLEPGVHLKDSQVQGVFKQSCLAVSFLHSLTPPIVHRDVKLENFLISNGVVKLCDFGSCTTKIVVTKDMPFEKITEAQEEIEQNTTPQNRAPEMLNMHDGKTVGPKADVWALGCALYYLCAKVHPFEAGEKLAIVNAKYKKLKAPMKNEKFIPLVEELLDVDPDTRPSASDIIAKLGGNPAETASPDETAKNDTDGLAAFDDKGGDASGSFFGRARDLISSAKNKSSKMAHDLLAHAMHRDDTKHHGGAAGNLDLTYICPRLMCLSTPVEGTLSKFIRNGTQEVSQYFGIAHDKNVTMFNVGERPVDVAKIGCKGESFGWPMDGGPSLDGLYRLCIMIQNSLEKNEIVAIHCETGKCHSGTAIASFLVYCSLVETAKDALRMFSMMRMIDCKPALDESHARYVQYIERITKGKHPHRRNLKLTKLIMQSVPEFMKGKRGCRPIVEVYENNVLKASYRKEDSDGKLHVFEPGSSPSIELDVEVAGDVRVVVNHGLVFMKTEQLQKMFAFQFHTGFVDGNGLELTRQEIEDCHGKNFDENFGIRLEAEITDATSQDGHTWLGCPPPVAGTKASLCFGDDAAAKKFLEDYEISHRKFVSLQRKESEDIHPVLTDDEDDAMKDAEPLKSKSSSLKTTTNLVDMMSLDPGETSQKVNEDNTLINFSSSSTNNDTTNLFSTLQQPQNPQPQTQTSTDIFGSQPATQQSNLNNNDNLLGDLLNSPAAQSSNTNGLNDLFGLGGTNNAPANVGAPTSTGSNDLFNNAPTTAVTTSRSTNDLFGMEFNQPPPVQRTTTNESLFAFGGPANNTATPTPTPQAPPANNGTTLLGDFDFSAPKPSVNVQPPAASFIQTPITNSNEIPTRANSQPQTANETATTQKASTQNKPNLPRNASKEGGLGGGGGLFSDFGIKKKAPEEQRSLRDMLGEERMRNEDPNKVKVEQWAEGKKENIRAYLSTLDQVLWEGATWGACNIGELMDPRSLKKRYYKASLLLHEDKVKIKAPEHADLAREIFIKLSQGYSKWEEEGSK